MLKQRFEPSLTFENLELPIFGNEVELTARAQEYGVQPIMMYRNFPIETGFINNFEFDCTGFIPTVKVEIQDWNNRMRNTDFAADDEPIYLYLNSRVSELKDVKSAFKILDYQYEDTTGVVQIFASLDVNQLYFSESKAYRQLTSLEVLENFAKEAGLGFVSNIEQTEDRMTWINANKSASTFLQEVTQHAYRDERSFFWSFIDPYYNLNFVEIEQEMSSDASKAVGILSLGNTAAMDDPDFQKSTNELFLFYGGPQSLGANNLEISHFKVVNRSTRKSLDFGYTFEMELFDRGGNWEKRAGNFNSFSKGANQTPNIENQNILLKGRVANRNEEFFNQNNHRQYFGKIDSNQHPNYLFAFAHNAQNIAELQKLCMIVTLAVPNFNLIRFQKIRVFIFNNISMENDSVENPRLSGAWLIEGIKWIKDETGVLRQQLVLVKRDLTLQNYNF